MIDTNTWILLAFFTGCLIGLFSQQAFWFMLEKSGMLVPGHAITAGELKRMLYSQPESASIMIHGADPRCDGVLVSSHSDEDGDWVVIRPADYSL